MGPVVFVPCGARQSLTGRAAARLPRTHPNWTFHLRTALPSAFVGTEVHTYFQFGPTPKKRGRFGPTATTCPSHSPPRAQLLGHDRRSTLPLGYNRCTHERCQLDRGARDIETANMRATNLVAMSAQIVIAQRLHVACCVAAFTFRALHGLMHACVRAGGLCLVRVGVRVSGH